MIRDIKQEENAIRVSSDKGEEKIHFKVKIDKVIQCQDSVIVLTAAFDPKEGAKNVHRFDESGAKVWTVEEPEGIKGQANAFTNIWLTEKGELMGYAWSGLAHQIDFQTGKILSTRLLK
ncbi:MAG: hypothetical protein A3G33_08455 [Omnitrophica bacterium RIFCSPLOWO2_12_FULL_44_17]|uniref:Uncharacterized protein n=1 Tax=Candidatus Danuiimicrobium aquiferis TaxID=1801832 RepID=A0A1G1KW81_9BACT|nr:MAG: hypothetical protein A3B72_03675 [Omnitrophica bacterium RIFCSPHIGHO2_02_FULL_45_28]OGW92053.1 MAG: hypothetical protein A3E74_01950 [Omnitrophica bacterium RIFCSPHIGHO2_12_FULL_44_12]OGW97196.1 MAG: hypothetical protein A3G33_08455 [Omnitrophica bacterium RIFCSPLOWO2_12_FULL_44_17]OGX02252.1 MAG: hypothetical protein A3J12_08245 [Omnitrophica bacterium RIFCSPLOWO2_02_FULL_44_11]